MAAGLVDSEGVVGEVVRYPTPRDPWALIETICAAARSRIELATFRSDEPIRVGLGTGGVVDPDAGVVLSASQVISGWAGVRLAHEVGARLGVDVVRVDNDGNTFAMAESRWGAAVGVRDALFIAVGTGVGGGLVLDGRLRGGPTHSAGEFGRMRLGVRSLESVASGPSLAAEYSRRTSRPTSDLRIVAAAARDGDPIARAVIDEGARAVGSAIALLAVALDIPLAVVGGGVADIGDEYLREVTRGARDGGAHEVLVVRASQGSLSSIAGAAALVLPS